MSSVTNSITTAVNNSSLSLAGFIPPTKDYSGIMFALQSAIAATSNKVVLFEDALYDLGNNYIPIVSGISYIGVPARFAPVSGGWTDKEPAIVGGTRFTTTANYVFWDGATNQSAITAVVTPQNATFVAGSANITITDGTKYTIGQRVYFTSTGYGFYVGVAYFVLSINANVITLGLADMVAISATASGTANALIGAGRPNDISSGVVMQHLAGVEVKTFIKAGAVNTYSFLYSIIEDIYARGILANRGTSNVSRLIDIVNYAQCDFSHIHTYDGDGQYWGAAYPLASFVPGNTVFSHLYNSNNGVGSTPMKQHGIVFQSEIGSTSNQQVVHSVQNNNLVISQVSVTTGAQVSGGTAISVPDSSVFPVGMPVNVSADVNGFKAAETYFVTSSAANSITLSLWKGGTAKSLSGTSAMTLQTYGFPGLEIVGMGDLSAANVTNVEVIGIDLEGASACKILAQNTSANLVLNSVAHTDSKFTVVGRAFNGFLFGKNRLITEFEGNCLAEIHAPRITAATDPYVGGTGLYFDYTNGLYGLSIHKAGRPNTPALAGISSPSGNWSKSFYPIGMMISATDTARTFGNSYDGGTWVFNGSAGVTWTLPTISDSSASTTMVGMWWEFINVSANTLTVATNGTQTINNVTGKTTMTVPAGAKVRMTAIKTNGGTLCWFAELTSAVQ